MTVRITITLESRLLDAVRRVADEDGRSVSDLVNEILEQAVLRRRNFEKAKKRALKRLKNARGLGWTPPASRDDLHQIG